MLMTIRRSGFADRAEVRFMSRYSGRTDDAEGRFITRRSGQAADARPLLSVIPLAAVLLAAVLITAVSPSGRAHAVALSLPPGPAESQTAGPRYSRALPAADVLIDAGHGGIDGGAHYGNILEKDINLAVAKRLYLLLRSQGITAVLNRTGDYALSDDDRWHGSRSRHQRDLSQRRGLTEQIDVGLLVSIHVNWSNRPSASGPLVLHQREGRSALLAASLQNALNREYGIRRLPRVGSPYYLLNLARCPAVIVELGFLSSPADRVKLTDPRQQQKLAEAIAAGIRHYLWTAGTER